MSRAVSRPLLLASCAGRSDQASRHGWDLLAAQEFAFRDSDVTRQGEWAPVDEHSWGSRVHRFVATQTSDIVEATLGG